jgi:hypothetical protein
MNRLADAQVAPQRQMLPVIAVVILLVGRLRVAREQRAGRHDLAGLAVAHCGTSISIQACCSGCVPSADKPSIVVMGALAADTGVWHDRWARPPTITARAALADAATEFGPLQIQDVPNHPQEGMSAGTSTVVVFPLTFKVNGMC